MSKLIELINHMSNNTQHIIPWLMITADGTKFSFVELVRTIIISLVVAGVTALAANISTTGVIKNELSHVNNDISGLTQSMESINNNVRRNEIGITKLDVRVDFLEKKDDH